MVDTTTPGIIRGTLLMGTDAEDITGDIGVEDIVADITMVIMMVTGMAIMTDTMGIRTMAAIPDTTAIITTVRETAHREFHPTVIPMLKRRRLKLQKSILT